MKATTSLLAFFAVSALTFSPLALHAQDDQQPPPPMDNGAPPPPQDQGQDQSQQPPDQGQGGDDSGVSFDQFYSGLSDQGSWIQTQDYGYVFQPTVQDPNWAPYTDGHWVYTDYGWTWASDEPWGWATYHYGRWVNVVGTGWVWVPGYQWAPAWVSWRYGGGYCGWAPLPPSTFVGVEFGGSGVNFGFDFHFGSDCDTAYGIGPGCYNFIAIGNIGDPYYRGHYIDRSRNFVIINNTRNITNIYVSRHSGNAFSAVRVGGPQLAEINAHSHTPVQQVRLARAGQAGRSTLSGGTLSVYAPHINPATLRTARPQKVSRSLSSVTLNRGTNVSQPLQVTRSFKPAAPPASVIAEAKEAQAHAPANVATASRIKPTARLTQPLTSMQTNTGQRHTTTPGATTYQSHPSAETVQHPSGSNSSTYNPQVEHNTQVEHEQQSQAQSSQAQQQREQAIRQQQTQSQEHEQTYHSQEQQPQVQQQIQHYKQQPQVQEHEQTYHPQQQQAQQQVQHYQQQPSQQHSQPSSSSQQHSSQSQGNGNNGQNNGNNQNGNGQHQGH